jgi:hypothetical protein
MVTADPKTVKMRIIRDIRIKYRVEKLSIFPIYLNRKISRYACSLPTGVTI